jgi:hypothetical protein
MPLDSQRESAPRHLARFAEFNKGCSLIEIRTHYGRMVFMQAD